MMKFNIIQTLNQYLLIKGRTNITNSHQGLQFFPSQSILYPASCRQFPK
jgi:hypothetical protein